ncbi:MAG: hypothetical protein KDA93_27170 [Planctomycetaceae bacterium]|nr:hypothetical protein [Planctomycetaceae bacterium]
MQEPEVNLKDPLIAAALAYLVPGLGHLYQGRLFKAAIYSVCILSLFGYGLWLSGGKIFQYRSEPGKPRTELLSFVAQCGVGLPGLFAINQGRRYRRSGDQVTSSLSEPLSSSFQGKIQVQQGDQDIAEEMTGTIAFSPAVGQFGDPTIVGRVTGTLANGQSVDYMLAEGTRLGPAVRNSPRRMVSADIVEEENGRTVRIGRLEDASIPRSFWNWFAVPLSHSEDQDLHRELGKYHELALVFTMIAGLLNVLAVWDAFDGPAYGYGLDTETDEIPGGSSVSAIRKSEPEAVGANS